MNAQKTSNEETDILSIYQSINNKHQIIKTLKDETDDVLKKINVLKEEKRRDTL